VFGSALKFVRDGLIAIAYPAECTLCGDSIQAWDDGVACQKCWDDPLTTVLLRDASICGKCGVPFRNGSSSQKGGRTLTSSSKLPSGPQGLRCGLCEDLPVDAIRSIGLYRGALQSSVLFLKSHPYLFRRLGSLMEQTYLCSAQVLRADIIIPIPLHPDRKKERGFNQAAVIAQAISRISKIPISENLLHRTKKTERHRAGMDPMDRAASLSGAFKVAEEAELASASVLLVDDLCTTGSTVGEAAAALRSAGASSVKAFTLARAILTS
jgi:ComF family protein